MSFVDPHATRAQGTSRPAPAEASDPDTRHAERSTARPLRSSGVRSERDRHAEQPVERPRGSSFRRTVDWERVGLVGVGVLVGALVGAGTALLLAPQSGAETRVAIRRRARAAGYRAGDAWDELAAELRTAARRRARRARRALTRARWKASDALL